MKGVGGKPFYEREKAGKVRNRALDDVLLILNADPVTSTWSDLKKQMLLKLASNLLPRINEHSGQDGEPVPLLVKFIDAPKDH